MSEEKNEQGQRRGLQRSLKARHMNMIAIGGAIGTGLFVAGGETISTAGPGGALLAYSLIGVMVYFLMTGLGEMAAYLPVSGHSKRMPAAMWMNPLDLHWAGITGLTGPLHWQPNWLLGL